MTGTFSHFSEKVITDSGRAANITWSLTVNSPNHTSFDASSSPSGDEYKLDLWLGTPAGVDFDDGSKGYSGYAIAYSTIPQNTILPGQQGDGKCTQILPQDCVDALVSTGENVGL